MQLSSFLSFFFCSFALGSPSDVLYIKKLVTNEARLLDAKDFAKLANIFTINATYNAGAPTPNVYGIDSIQTTLANIFLQGAITQNAVSTASITLLPPFDEQGAAGTAAGVVDTTVTYIGQGDVAGQSLIFFAKYEDKYVKTGDFGTYGGWRISERLYFYVGKAVGSRDVLPPSQRALVPP